MDCLQDATEERSKATGLIFCLEDSFMKKFSSPLREKILRVFFSGWLHDKHGKRNSFHTKTQLVPRSKHAPAPLF